MELNSLDKKIGERIRKLRELNKETQIDLANIIKSNQNNISKIESGKSLTIDNLISIAKHYKVSLDYLCTGVTPPSELEILKKYLNFEYCNYKDSQNKYSLLIPLLKINRVFLDYITQKERIMKDKNITEEIRAKWLELELEKFKLCIEANSSTECISVIPLPEEIAKKYEDILLVMASKNLI